MIMPPPKPDTLFEELLQDLPPELEEDARKFKAFSRSRKIKTVDDLMRAVLLYSGVDHSLRQAAGNLALLGTILTDEGLRKRLNASSAWVKAILPKMLRHYKGNDLPGAVFKSRSMPLCQQD